MLWWLLPGLFWLCSSALLADLWVQHQATALTQRLADHLHNTLDEADILLQLLADKSQGQCTPEALALLRSLAYDYEEIREAAIIRHNAIACSSWGEHLPAQAISFSEGRYHAGSHQFSPLHGSAFHELENYSLIMGLGLEEGIGVNLLLVPETLFAPLQGVDLPYRVRLTLGDAERPLAEARNGQPLLMFDAPQLRLTFPDVHYSRDQLVGPLQLQLALDGTLFWQNWLWALPLTAGLLLLLAGGPLLLWQRIKRDRCHLSHAVSHELARAIHRQEFFIQYLPTLDNQTGYCIGAEALIRWRHPRQGIIMPDLFIPIAERTGMIVPMTQWLIEQMAAEMGGWLRAHPECYLSLNVSSAHFESRLFLQRAVQTLQRHGISPDQITLEITERELLDKSDEATRKALQLANQYGFKLAIDDFGTGYNNLARLYEFGFELIKIDRSLVRTAVDKEGGDRVFDAILTVANGYGAPVLVEGVEQVTDVAFLASRQVHSLQGWYFSRPVGAQEFQQFHARHQPDSASSVGHEARPDDKLFMPLFS